MTTERFDRAFLTVVGWTGNRASLTEVKTVMRNCYPRENITDSTYEANIAFMRVLGLIIDHGKIWAKNGESYNFLPKQALQEIKYTGQANLLNGLLLRIANVSYSTGWERFSDYVLRKAGDQ